MNFQFEEQQYTRRSLATPKASGIAGLLIKSGVAKNMAEANMWMIGIIVVLGLFMSWMIFGGGDGTYKPPKGIDPETNLPYGVPAPK